MKRALIITYYWPPSGGAGVQRWLKFAKYLPEYGWQPVIYTPSNPEYPSEDASLLKDVPPEAEIIQTEIREPYDLYRKWVGAEKGEKINTGFLTETERPKRSEVFSRWVRGNFFIPDARKWWIKPSIKFLTKYVEENPVDVIISTGPPHSMHLIAKGLKRKTGLPWMADFRDPWTQIDFYEELRLSGPADRKHHRLEKAVLEQANVVVGAWPAMQDLFHQHAKPRKLEVITNGFDPDDLPAEVPALDKEFSIAHVGSFSPARNPSALWKALDELRSEVPGFAERLVIKLAGKTDVTVRKEIEQRNLHQHLRQTNYLPHAKIADFQRSSQVLLLIANKAPTSAMIIPGKVFEYFSANRPILAICPEDGDLAKMVLSTETGVVVGHDQAERTKRIIREMYQQYLEADLKVYGKQVNVYSRKALTKKLAQLLNDLISE